MLFRSPASYRYILDNIYPRLRHSDYTVTYTVRPFSIEEAKEILKTKPQQLSLQEMFLVAQTYEPGSPEFNEVFDIAVRLFPDDETATGSYPQEQDQSAGLLRPVCSLSEMDEEVQTLGERRSLRMRQPDRTGQYADCGYRPYFHTGNGRN